MRRPCLTWNPKGNMVTTGVGEGIPKVRVMGTFSPIWAEQVAFTFNWENTSE